MILDPVDAIMHISCDAAHTHTHTYAQNMCTWCDVHYYMHVTISNHWSWGGTSTIYIYIHGHINILHNIYIYILYNYVYICNIAQLAHNEYVFVEAISAAFGFCVAPQPPSCFPGCFKRVVFIRFPWTQKLLGFAPGTWTDTESPFWGFNQDRKRRKFTRKQSQDRDGIDPRTVFASARQRWCDLRPKPPDEPMKGPFLLLVAMPLFLVASCS